MVGIQLLSCSCPAGYKKGGRLSIKLRFHSSSQKNSPAGYNGCHPAGIIATYLGGLVGAVLPLLLLEDELLLEDGV
jgi:hypothetical protein